MEMHENRSNSGDPSISRSDSLFIDTSGFSPSVKKLVASLCVLLGLTTWMLWSAPEPQTLPDLLWEQNIRMLAKRQALADGDTATAQMIQSELNELAVKIAAASD